MICENVADYLAQNAARRPEWPALKQGERTLTYRDLYVRVLALGAELQARGIDRGDIVGIAMRDGIDYALAMLAVFRIGAVLLPMDSRWTGVERDNVARHFEARAVLVDDGPDQVGGAPAIRFDPAMLARDPSTLRLPQDFSADEPLVLSLSSGTTGLPKGPMISHRHFMLRHYTEWLALGYLQTDVNLCATPLYFGGGRYFTLSYLMAGGTVVINAPPYRVDELAHVIRRHGVTTTFMVPTLLRRIADEGPEVRGAFQGLRFIVSSGSSLHPQEAAELAAKVNACIVNHYASTEGGSISMHHPLVEGPANGSVGRPLLGTQVEIADADDRALPTGETGLIRHKAPWHPKGFHNNPEETAKYFRGGWYYTGDVGHFDTGGFLHITGRSKDMIIRGGVNIYPEEIEAALMAEPAIADAAVVGRPSPILGEEVVAFVVASPGLDAEAVRGRLKESLAAYKIPAELIVVDEMPRNQSGKIVKARLRARFDEAA